jgi:hypothetical protein
VSPGAALFIKPNVYAMNTRLWAAFDQSHLNSSSSEGQTADSSSSSSSSNTTTLLHASNNSSSDSSRGAP